MKRLPLGVVLFLFALGGLSGCGEKIEPGTTPSTPGPTVKAAVAEARISQQPLIYEAVGTIQPRTASTLSSKVMGAVLHIRVKEGDVVKAGEELVVLDSRWITTQLQQAEAGLAEARKAETAALAALDAAKAHAVRAEKAFERTRKLLEGEAATREDFEAAQAAYSSAGAGVSGALAMLEASRYRVKQAQAAVEGARVSLKDTVILSPYDGKVTAKMMEEGDMAAPGTPLLVLEKEGEYQADVILPETYIRGIRKDQKVQVEIPSVSEQAFTGTVETIVPRADVKSRTFLLKVTLPEHLSLKPGLFARVAVPVGEDHLLLVPSSAVVSQGQLRGIYLLNKENVARFRLIRTGRTFGDRIEIVTGLDGGDRFLVSPPPQTVDGARIEIVS
ncbi:MAG: efflux RND transporter periplasmic adaptor subunit [Deltaproteobacteria bacterium]|nr:efflux RND transporter periplasmic adaptor subunit [Deltaproteobacteria bacterium]